MHRRTNSYSYTATERVAPAYAEFSNTSSTKDFVRGTTGRRSFERIKQPLLVQSKLRHPGYFAVNIGHAVPAAIKYAVSEDASCTLPLPCKVPSPSILAMQRPRSPSKSSRTESSSDDSLLDQTLADIKEQLSSLKMQRNKFVERMDSLQRGIYQAGQDMLRHRHHQQTTSTEHQSTPTTLRRIHSMEGHSHSYTRLPISQTETVSSLGEEASESSLNLVHPTNDKPAQPKEGFSPMWQDRKSMPVIPNCSVPSQTSFPNGFPLRRNSSLSSREPSKVLPSIKDRRFSSSSDGSYSDECTSPTNTVTFSNSSSSKVLVNPCKSSKLSSSRQTNYNSYTLPYRPVTPPSSALQNVNEDESFDGVSCSDSLVDEVSPGSVIMRVSSATGQLEQVPKIHHPVKKQNSGGSLYANLTWQKSSTSPNSSNHLLDTSTLNRADGVILRLAQEPCRSPKTYRMRKANSIILNSIETTV